MTTSERWIRSIEQACDEPDPVRSNQQITKLHYLLSIAIADALGREAGPNFHTWAVWGSRKAGSTIRQEDLDSAIRNATVTAGLVGTLVGIAVGVFAGRVLDWKLEYLNGLAGAAIGALSGAWSGKMIAIWSRAKAARLVLEGNQAVIRDIGEQSARFLELLENGAVEQDRERFFAGLRVGTTERRGQDRLKKAFRCYLAAFEEMDLDKKRAAMIAGNCEIVYHEHIQLEPFIRGAMPFIVRRCATQRMMNYEIGGTVLAVAEAVPGSSNKTAARNWTRIEERMRYVFALFSRFHNLPEVFSSPYPEVSIAQSSPSV
jgi:hypothetical protein